MQKQIRKKIISCCLVLFLVPALAGCSLLKPAERSAADSGEQSKTDSKTTGDQDSQDAENGKKDRPNQDIARENESDSDQDKSNKEAADSLPPEMLSSEQAKAKLIEDYAAYQKELADNGVVDEWMPISVISAENLYEVKEEELRKMRLCDELIGIGFYQVRERYPGKYQWYLMFKTEKDRAKYESVTPDNKEYMRLTCFYVNLNTGKTFIDDSLIGAFALSDMENAAYIPSVFDGLVDRMFLLWVLEKNGIIDRVSDYADAWSMAEELDLDWEDNVGEAITKLGGEWDESVDYTYQEDDIYRFPVYHRETYERVGIYDLNVRYRTVTDYYTGKELYRDPLANYQPKNLTKKSAVKELFHILKKLYIVSPDEIKGWRSEVKEFESDDTWMPEGYEITLWPPQSQASVIYRINRKGTKVSCYDPERDEYERIYGTAMWYKESAD